MSQLRVSDESQSFLSVFPPAIASALLNANHSQDLIEVVLDLGGFPTAVFTDHELTLTSNEVTEEDINAVIANVGGFDGDNRAGLKRTLHRISAIRNRHNDIIGLTCRMGRACYGAGSILEDFIFNGKSVLVLGRPGVGKTTLLRDLARILAEKKRVIVVDTSNEIGGDGDIPHVAIGRARRMQVREPDLQYEVMIEAVENHTPHVIVCDEIGRESEARAARTIAERGVQLIATAHGSDLESVLLNPTLSDLIGGIEVVVLSDEIARVRGTQKTIRERKSTPTFDILVELDNRNNLFIYHDVAAAVDSFLAGTPLSPERRFRDETTGDIVKMNGKTPDTQMASAFDRAIPSNGSNSRGQRKHGASPALTVHPVLNTHSSECPLKLYPHGVSRRLLFKAIRNLKMPILVVREPAQAEVVLTLREIYREKDQFIKQTEAKGMPIHVVGSNSLDHLESALLNMKQWGTEASA